MEAFYDDGLRDDPNMLHDVDVLWLATRGRKLEPEPEPEIPKIIHRMSFTLATCKLEFSVPNAPNYLN